MYKVLLTISLLVAIAVPMGGVLAATPSMSDYLTKIKLGGATGTIDQFGLKENLSEPISMAINAALALVGSVFLILTVYAGILWMTSSGNEEGVGKAKKILFMAIIGLGITMAAAAITAFVQANYQ